MSCFDKYNLEGFDLEPDLSGFDAARKHVPGCAVANLKLDVSQRSTLEEAIRREGEYSVQGITKVVQGWGFPIGKESVRAHRSRECACGRPK